MVIPFVLVLSLFGVALGIAASAMVLLASYFFAWVFRYSAEGTS
jgi:hypothetical protein